MSSIGTGGRDYASISLWAAALTNVNFPTPGTEEIGELYADSDFTEGEIAISPESNISKCTLSVHPSQRHDGTDAGGGARFLAGQGWDFFINSDHDDYRCEWIDIDFNGLGVDYCFLHNTSDVFYANILYHDARKATSQSLSFTYANNRRYHLLNCVGYALAQLAGGSQSVNFTHNSNALRSVLNCTVHDIESTTPSGAAYCFAESDDSAPRELSNCIGGLCFGSGAGTYEAFRYASYSNRICRNNLTTMTNNPSSVGGQSDTTANLFISDAAPYVLLLNDNANNAIGNAIDFGTSPPGVEIDILGRDRDANDDIWDIGAHQTAATAAEIGIRINGAPITGMRINGVSATAVKINGVVIPLS